MLFKRFIHSRYATALFSAASKQKSLSKVESDLNALSSLLAKDVKVKEFLENPLLDRSLKKKGLAIILKDASQTTHNFFDVLADNGRLPLTEKVLEAFKQLLQASRGQLQATVTSAKDLDAKTIARLQQVLQKSALLEGKELTLVNKVDPQIIGGLVIELGEKTIDLSVSSKITKLNNLLSAAV